MKSPRYIWKYYIRPFILDIDPNTREGLNLRAEKLKEDNPDKGTEAKQ